MDNLKQLNKDHTRVMLLLNECEYTESTRFHTPSNNTRSLERIRSIELDLIDEAEKLTGQIYDLKHQARKEIHE